MAVNGRELAGKDVLLWIKREAYGDRLADENYLLVACLTSNDFSGSTGTTDTTSKCGESSTPGVKTASWAIGGNVLLSPGTANPEWDADEVQMMSAPELYELWNNDEKFDYYVGKAKSLEIDGDWSLNGRGYFSAFGWANPQDGQSQFSATLTADGMPESILADVASV